MIYNRHGFLQNNASLISLLQQVLDPFIAILLIKFIDFLVDEPKSIALHDWFLMIISFLLIIVAFDFGGVYYRYRTTPIFNRIIKIFFSWFLVLTILSFIGFITKSSDLFSRTVIIIWAVLTPFVISGLHILVGLFLSRVRAMGFNRRTAIVIGMNSASAELVDRLGQTPHIGINVKGFFVHSRFPELSDHPSVLGDFSDVRDYVKTKFPDIVYITHPLEDSETIANLIEQLQDTTACVYCIPNSLILNLLNSRLYELNGMPLIALWEVPFTQVQYALKRLFDIGFSSIALLFCLPIFAIIILAIKLTSPGPVFFQQDRYGLNGRKIKVLKFRTMRVMENDQVVIQAKRNDPRVTSIGKFLRKTSLDELPQFINVLRGDMSVVGPRPHAVAHNELYRKKIQGYMLRHKIKPGITGWAQVNGSRGETDTLDKMQKRIDYDLEYLDNWSLWLDIKIIIKTVAAVFARQNAY
ncbi:undecaprenyl-phosphate glucose phosphotransferase [Thermosynechococcaceae cyanobacterium BACA0444]|uniref:Undecaprenyl-phosphate glucose phosphotransferase n=1 Tax=Pseudocalidococcus azoricus BACA0444 TaxID=2918990 RepID=A0AAE4JYM1_9CYAN|nr:undecaprenyl-phosphate glucose phosphotransferase [Pseudocalidococcus azoricus]MDS3859872.1 undecaprenyl-phosphate glucose phosphotransferase [Pseudocalidococcus azoricus BACA0444]